jgi:hypothetical protein
LALRYVRKRTESEQTPTETELNLKFYEQHTLRSAWRGKQFSKEELSRPNLFLFTLLLFGPSAPDVSCILTE